MTKFKKSIEKLDAKELFDFRDALKRVFIYVDLPTLRKIQAEVAERLEELKERQ